MERTSIYRFCKGQTKHTVAFQLSHCKASHLTPCTVNMQVWINKIFDSLSKIRFVKQHQSALEKKLNQLYINSNRKKKNTVTTL